MSEQIVITRKEQLMPKHKAEHEPFEYADVIIGISPRSLDTQGFHRLIPIFYARIFGQIRVGRRDNRKAGAIASAFTFETERERHL